MTFRTFVRPLFVALSLAFATTAAAPAFADGSDAKPAEHRRDHDKKEHKKTGDKAKAKSFPMAADKFTKMVDGHLAKAKERLDAGLSKHKVEGDAKAKILKDFDDGAALVKAAAKRAGKDGEVSKEEAKEVRSLTKSLREQVRSRYAPKKGEHKKGEHAKKSDKAKDV